MSRAWVGYLAVGFLFLSGVLEFFGGYPKLGVFLVILSFVSLFLRMYLNKKIREHNKNN